MRTRKAAAKEQEQQNSKVSSEDPSGIMEPPAASVPVLAQEAKPKATDKLNEGGDPQSSADPTRRACRAASKSTAAVELLERHGDDFLYFGEVTHNAATAADIHEPAAKVQRKQALKKARPRPPALALGPTETTGPTSSGDSGKKSFNGSDLPSQLESCPRSRSRTRVRTRTRTQTQTQTQTQVCASAGAEAHSGVLTGGFTTTFSAPSTGTLMGPQAEALGTGNGNGETQQLFCVCHSIDDGMRPMIQCDSCADWFHFTCVGIKEVA